jgi:hypothetical protein
MNYRPPRGVTTRLKNLARSIQTLFGYVDPHNLCPSDEGLRSQFERTTSFCNLECIDRSGMPAVAASLISDFVNNRHERTRIVCKVGVPKVRQNMTFVKFNASE